MPSSSVSSTPDHGRASWRERLGALASYAVVAVIATWPLVWHPRALLGAPQGAGDTLLHRMACEMHSQKLFNIILTPNYNALHRDHMHVDLTPASATIRGEDMGVDPAHPELLDE